jgi:hypothetical protein
MLSTTKIYIDGRHSLPNPQSGTASLQIEIPGGIELHPKTKVWLSEFTCPASWDTVDASNNTLYVRELGEPDRVLLIPTGAHDIESLRFAMQESLNGPTKNASMGIYSVVRTGSSGNSGGTSRLYRITCSAGSFELPNYSNASANSLSSIVAFPTGIHQLITHVSSFVDLRRVHSVYIHSNIGSYQSIGPRGERTILAKVPANTGYGGLVTYNSSASEHDYVDAGAKSLNMIKLELKDSFGRLINMNGGHWSATILFGL